MNNDIYSLTSGQYLENLYSVDNTFIRELANLSMQEASQLRMVQFVQKGILSNRGELADRSVKLNDKSVINMNKLPALNAEMSGCKTLADEIAKYRMHMLDFDYVDDSFAKAHQELLMVDYLLSACVCYVEVFDGSAKVQKFFATRNRFIAGGLSGLEPKDTSKYINYLTPLRADYDLATLRVLKLNMAKNGSFKIVQPRSGLNFNACKIKVTPLFLLMAFVNGVSNILKNNIVKFKYIKDNITERELITTLSHDIMMKYYDDAELVGNVMNRCETMIERGFIRVPELGISRYDETGVRSLNLSRITSLEIIDSVDTSYINVDFSTILPSFKATIEGLFDLNALAMVYMDLGLDFNPDKSVVELKEMLIAHVDGQYAIGTSTFLRSLHNVMMNNVMIFNSYNGGKPATYEGFNQSFNLGCL